MAHHHHRKHHIYSFKNFTHDISAPFITVERDINGTVRSLANSKLGLGLGIATPIIIILGGGIAIYVLTRGK